jgi:hypothetical protein
MIMMTAHASTATTVITTVKRTAIGVGAGATTPEKRRKLVRAPVPTLGAVNVDAHIDTLMIDGAVVLRIDELVNDLAHLRERFDAAVRGFPEFAAGTRLFVLGGFGALGNASSFHNMFARDLRAKIHRLLAPFFGKLCPSKDWKLEQVYDRMMFRLAGLSPSAEAWHRDECPGADDEDLVFGGWMNLDMLPQTFSCVKGTHVRTTAHEPGVASGFAPIHKSLRAGMTAAKSTVTVPPGCILIFYEHLVHEVVATKRKYDSRRMFLGWRLTRSDEPLGGTNELMCKISSQAPVPLKSAQQPPMHAKLHWVNWRGKLVTFSENFVDNAGLFETRVVGSGQAKGESYRLVKRFLPSLRELGMPMYPDYTSEEVSIHVPRKEWGEGDSAYRLHQ